MYELSLFNILLLLVLMVGSFYVVSGIVEGFYWLCGRLFGYLPTTLKQPFNTYSLRDTSLLFNVLIVFLDGVIHWISYFILITVYYFMHSIMPSLYLELLVVYLAIGLSFVFIWRLFIRIYHWLTIRYASDNNSPVFIQIGLAGISMICALLIHYGLLFGVQYLNGYIMIADYLSELSIEYLYYLYVLHFSAIIPYLMAMCVWLAIHIFDKKQGWLYE